jgi:CRISPR/Cas system-associated exonuclease Cas4 (RecB family)
VDEIARAGGEWMPLRFEWAFGYQDGGALAVGRDPRSRREPVVIDGRFQLHGSIDLIEEHAAPATARHRSQDRKVSRQGYMMVGGGAVLQPVLYSLALEQATRTSRRRRTALLRDDRRRYRDVRIPLTPQARRLGVEVLEIIDRAIETGFLAPAPAEKACSWCDFPAVCGPTAERRVSRFKAQEPLADLLELRRKP